MRRTMIAYLLVLVFATPTLAWNDKGHMTVAYLTYQKLSPAEREVVLKILKRHPHYDEFLAADRPDNVPEAQWVFWRAAVWPDWVRRHHQAAYNHPAWHYVDYPFIFPGSKEKAADHQPSDVDAVTKLPFCIEKVKSGTDQEKAIYLCWVSHLIGDIHQPLHCVSLFSEKFTQGDRGGNLAKYRLASGHVITLHPFWDGLLGKRRSLASVAGASKEAQEVAEKFRAEVTHDLQANKAIESWAKETFALAVKYAYLDGKVQPANTAEHPSEEDIPRVADTYATDAGRIARLAIFKAAERLTETLKQIVH